MCTQLIDFARNNLFLVFVSHSVRVSVCHAVNVKVSECQCVMVSVSKFQSASVSRVGSCLSSSSSKPPMIHESKMSG